MNADAKPFNPSQPVPLPVPSAPIARPQAECVPVPSALVAKPQAAASVLVAGEDEPEWMQYLSKKLNANALPKQPPANNYNAGKGGQRRQGAGRPPQAFPVDPGGGFLASRRDQGANERGDAGPGGGGSTVIHTEAYLKLLKDGALKKKTPNTHLASKRGDKLAPAWSTKATTQGDLQQIDLPMTTSSLVKRWNSSVSKLPGAQELLKADSTEEVTIQHTTQDDIWLSRMLIDQDLSDPAYFSDTDMADIKNHASVHRLARRPKVAMATIRTYVMQDLNFSLDEAVGMLLMRLQRFMDQQRIFSASTPSEKEVPWGERHQQRRFVIGLKEVARRTKQAKVECLIVAPDIEEDANSGGLDDRMRELLASAYQNNIPVIFALSRARLGKALGKSLHISVLGVLDAYGAAELLKESVQLASDCRQTWLTRLEK